MIVCDNRVAPIDLEEGATVAGESKKQSVEMAHVADTRAEFVQYVDANSECAGAEKGISIPGGDGLLVSKMSNESFEDVEKGIVQPAHRGWREADPLHESTFTKFLRTVYFPFVVRFHVHMCVAWIAILAVSGTFGPGFLSNTRSNLDLPAGTPSAAAVKAFEENYPQASSWPPAFIVFHANTPGQSVIGSFSQTVSKQLDDYAKKHSDVISGVGGYWEFIGNPNTVLLAQRAVSADNQTMMATIQFSANATLPAITDLVYNIIDFASAHSSADVSVSCTGTFPLFNEMSKATESNFALIDGTVLPIAICILGFTLRSYRHMGVAFCNLICTLLLAFALLVPVSNAMDINPFAPSVMLSLGIAVCFDYSLFMLTRFREERLVRCKSKEDAVFASLAAAGHVVCLSGATLFATFLLLVAFPQNFLQSVGTGCATVVLTAMISNMTITPAMLLTFDCLSHFDAFPSSQSCCCRIPPGDPGELAAARRAAAGGGAAVAESGTERTPRTLWFKMAYGMTRHAYLVLLVALGVTVPFAMAFFNMTPTSDNYLVYLQGSPSVDALKLLSASFPEGSMDPYDVIVTTGKRDGVLSADYFKVENAMVNDLIRAEGAYMSASGVKALSFYNGQNISLGSAKSFLDASSPAYHTPLASAYRIDVATMMNSERSASMINIQTTVSPDAEIIVGFILDVRRIIDGYTKASPVPSLPVQVYLFGGYTTTLDVQNALYGVVPIEIGVTIAIVVLLVGTSFGSVGLAARLIFTILVSLAWTYGLMVLVYQPGPAQTDFERLTPTLSYSTGIYWIVPVMSFSILVGLALDYDIFLMTRVVEFRRKGWSDRAAVCLAIERTAGIITAAGLIMSVSFAGLLIPKTVVLNQYGFALFIGVAFDTFIVRTSLVPAVVTILGVPGVNWWPARMPPVLLSPADEDRALAAGLWDPLLVDDAGNILALPAAAAGGGDLAGVRVEGKGGAGEVREDASSSGASEASFSSPAAVGRAGPAAEGVELAAVYRPAPADGAVAPTAAPAVPLFDHGLPIRELS